MRRRLPVDWYGNPADYGIGVSCRVASRLVTETPPRRRAVIVTIPANQKKSRTRLNDARVIDFAAEWVPPRDRVTFEARVRRGFENVAWFGVNRRRRPYYDEE